MSLKKTVSLITAIAAAAVLASCGSGTETADETAEHTDQETAIYAFLAKDVQNPYMQMVYEGFASACSELDAEPLYKGAETGEAVKQIEIISELIDEGVAGIAVDANDYDALQPSLKQAMDAGIQVISLDSAVNKDSRKLHIQQADPEQVGRKLIQAAYDITGGSGGIAVLSAVSTATNQNAWINWMKTELAENPEKYAGMTLVDIVYGDDDPAKSAEAAKKLLKNADVDVIISPTTVGMLAAAKVIQSEESDVKLTGLGLPSEMADYIESGICPEMYLWNPIEVGELAAYTMDALVSGKIEGTEGETFATNAEIGEKTVTAASDGGTEVVLGEPMKFDAENIAEWRDIY